MQPTSKCGWIGAKSNALLNILIFQRKYLLHSNGEVYLLI